MELIISRRGLKTPIAFGVTIGIPSIIAVEIEIISPFTELSPTKFPGMIEARALMTIKTCSVRRWRANRSIIYGMPAVYM